MKYIHKFNTNDDYRNYIMSAYEEPHVSYTKSTNKIKYNLSNDEQYEFFKNLPLTFVILDAGNIIWTTSSSSYNNTIKYSKNGGEWTSITSTTGGVGIPVLKGDIVQFKGTNTTFGNASYHSGFDNSSCKFNVCGNIMSIIQETDFSSLTTLSTNYQFAQIFGNCNYLINASNLILPATTLTKYCYGEMFAECTNLTSAPELPATTLARSCYEDMFSECTNLTSAPKLPATTLADYCYAGMFYQCTNLTSAPELPATTLAEHCYSGMFHGCTGLTTAPELPATTLQSLCYNGIFYNCTNLTTAPELPATTLAYSCYWQMFRGCTRLNYIKAMFTTTPSDSYTWNWVDGVSATGTFVKNSAAQWDVSGVNGIPEGWTVQNATD